MATPLPTTRRIRRALKPYALPLIYTIKWVTNPLRLAMLQTRRSLNVHLGCGIERLPDFVNIDLRPSLATDVLMNLNSPRFAEGSVSVAYSNAFFEHLYRSSRLKHLQGLRRAMGSSGVCCYIGIPYFKNVAKFYLERAPGTAGPIFDLYNVYRYTQGDPERVPGRWLEQLHKSLFDEEEIKSLLSQSGFGSFVIFCYSFPGDVHELPVNLGFYASCESRPVNELRSGCLAFLERFADWRIRMNTLEWVGS